MKTLSICLLIGQEVSSYPLYTTTAPTTIDHDMSHRYPFNYHPNIDYNHDPAFEPYISRNPDEIYAPMYSPYTHHTSSINWPIDAQHEPVHHRFPRSEESQRLLDPLIDYWSNQIPRKEEPLESKVDQQMKILHPQKEIDKVMDAVEKNLAPKNGITMKEALKQAIGNSSSKSSWQKTEEEEDVADAKSKIIQQVKNQMKKKVDDDDDEEEPKKSKKKEKKEKTEKKEKKEKTEKKKTEKDDGESAVKKIKKINVDDIVDSDVKASTKKIKEAVSTIKGKDEEAEVKIDAKKIEKTVEKIMKKKEA